MKLWRDWYFGAALFAAPVFLTLVIMLSPGQPIDPVLPQQQPGRFLGLALILPVMEEVIFRGAMQPVIAASSWGGKALGGLTAANFFTSIVFSAVHLFYHPPIWALTVFFPSLIFGYFRDRHNSLLSPIILHVTYNLAYYWFIWG